MASGDTKTEAMLNALGNGGSADEFRGCCNTKTQQYILDAIDRVQNVEDEVEELKNNPDVVDIVDTYADLQAYDTQHLTENDIIRVLQDETHSGNSTYYRFTKNPDTWTFIGEIAGGSSVNVVQTTGTSTTDIMSQDATTKMVFKGNNTTSVCIGYNADVDSIFSNVAIGHGAKATKIQNVAIGRNATADKDCSIAVGYLSNGKGTYSVAIGYSSNANGNSSVTMRGIANGENSVAIGYGSNATLKGQFDIGAQLGTKGYNDTDYRLLTGLYDGQNDHDAVTLGQLNTRLGNLTITTISQSDYNNLQTKDPNTLYVITGA